MTIAFLAFSTILGAYQGASIEVRGTIEGSLRKPLGDRAPALAAQVARLIRWRGDMVRNVQPRDKVTVLYSLQEEGPILEALDYEGMELNIRAYRFTDEVGIARYVDENGTWIEPQPKAHPLPTAHQITETVQGGSGKRKHQGIDFKAPEGEPVVAPKVATVNRINWSTRRNGNCVEIRYQDGVTAKYLHLSSIRKALRPGMRLAIGESFAKVGNTGRSSAAHLHYELRDRRGKLLDPLVYHGSQSASLGPITIPAFGALREELDREIKAARDNAPI